MNPGLGVLPLYHSGRLFTSLQMLSPQGASTSRGQYSYARSGGTETLQLYGITRYRYEHVPLFLSYNGTVVAVQKSGNPYLAQISGVRFKHIWS